MDNKKEVNNLNKDFEELMSFCRKRNFSKEEINYLCEPLEKMFRAIFFKKFIWCVSIFILLYLSINYVDLFNWIASAFGRILLIKLLPIWNWPNLYNARCLVEYKSDESESVSSKSFLISETDEKNCVLCGNFEKIDVLSNVSFFNIQNKYLDRGLPVLIQDSHDPIDFIDFFNNIKNVENFVDSDPCDIETSFLLNHLSSIDEILHKIEADESVTSFFFHLRNCNFDAVKASRQFIPRSYFYSTHLDPYYSSWIIMSVDFSNVNKHLVLDGLVMVQQIAGEIEIHLKSKLPCENICGTHNLLLLEGESLIFPTDLWIFSYTLKENHVAATVITETHWK